jgi:signal transduction histidine kinase
LLAKNYLLKKSIREIYTAFENCLSEDTNVQITVSSGDKTVTHLAKAINHQLTKLRKIKQQYSDGDRELKEAITNISHDLRTPLTAICGYLDLLEKQNHSEDTERYIEQIRNRSEVLKQLTEELFRYSIISSTPELSYEKVNLCRVLEESLISFEGTMQQVGIQPEIQMPSVPVWRTLDYSAVVRVFGNIINNAIRYSDGDFEVHLEENGKITFSNTANKLTTVEVGKLFDRFYTVDTARKSTGLGLAIAKTLVEKMNGKIEANIKNKKLNIVICFPE